MTELNKKGPRGSSAFTVLEVIIVIGIVAFIYVVALPNFNLKSGTEVANKVGRLSEDIKSAYDYSVLTRKPLRMVFHLASGDYWVESTDATHVKLGAEKVLLDPVPEEERRSQEEFDETFQEYVELAGEELVDEKTNEPIPIVTPVLQAKDKLRGPNWYRLDSLEWKKRNLGEFLIIKNFQAEHHERVISLEDHGEEAIAMLYFLPVGYVEHAMMHIYFRDGEGRPDENEVPYTLETNSYLGVLDVRAGFEEIDLRTSDK